MKWLLTVCELCQIRARSSSTAFCLTSSMDSESWTPLQVFASPPVFAPSECESGEATSS